MKSTDSHKIAAKAETKAAPAQQERITKHTPKRKKRQQDQKCHNHVCKKRQKKKKVHDDCMCATKAK